MSDDFSAQLASAFTPPARSLEGRTALVTGASAGIGAAIAVQLLAEGAHVRAVARRADRLALLAEFAKAQGLPGSLEVRAGDVTSPDFREALADAGWTDSRIFVCNAGLARGLDPVSTARLEDWREMIATNVTAAFELTQHVVRAMRARGGGHVVALGSIAGHWAYENGSVYCATKHAVRAFFQALRQETCGENLRVTCVSPGMVHTEFSAVRFRGDAERADAVYAGAEALSPADVASHVIFALKQPSHVNVDEIVCMPVRQGSPFKLVREASR
jgi:NADP-dependent 3-hydroxy acid dehydrogenase YdfG